MADRHELGVRAGPRSVIELHRGTFGSLLGYALDHELWDEAPAILGPLDLYGTATGLSEETEAWADRVLLASEASGGTPPGGGPV